ncbi:MAG TPA: type IV secretory system conjugative DNA transfer family protein [Oligoflexia bacterium]|nr:type IV secretory system conjugative DNA transfer family protein [Oligoflexia bacterium]HMP27711.1 type IV secretory system conjugative DNA transfer family protein [Oligoflexia bacterium]
MLKQLELAIINFCYWFYTLPPVVGIMILGSITVVLFFKQYFRRKETYIPGGLAVLFAAATFLHVFDPSRVLKNIANLRQALLFIDYSRSPIPWFETFFSFLVAPFYQRLVVEELLCIALLGYLISLVVFSMREYKKTGLIFGDFSISRIVSNEVVRPERSKSNELGSADLASANTIARWTKPSGKKCDTLLHVRDIIGSEGLIYKRTTFHIPNNERNRHILTIAKTGGGKTTRLIWPVLYNDCLDPERSTIVFDSKPEMWRKFGRLTKKHCPNKQVLLFNPLDRERSLSWNILGKIQDDTDCKLIANTIIMATDQPQAKSDSPFFRNNALAVLNSIMVGLLHDPHETLSMPRVHELVQSGMKNLCNWLEARPHAIRNTRSFVELARSGSQNADTIMSELSMRLSAWDLVVIRATTSQMELDLEQLIQKPTLLIVELRESEIEMLRPLANVMVVEILRFLVKRAESFPGGSLPRPVGLIIDEFASALGRLPDIHVKLNTLRSRNVSIVAAIQSIGQIKAVYGDDADSVLAGFTTKIIMPPVDFTDAEWASKETGQMTIRFKTTSTGSNKKLTEMFASNNDGSQEQVQQRAVLTPDEIGRPADNRMTIFLPNTPVFQGSLIPHYEMPEMLSRINEFDSPDKELKVRDAPIPYIEDLAALAAAQQAASGSAAAVGSTPANPLFAGVTDTTSWTLEQVRNQLEKVKKESLDWDNCTGSARKWWETFENQNLNRLGPVLQLAEQLAYRKATITEFFMSYIYSNTDNIEANLHFLDYNRIKKEDEKRKKEGAVKAA